MKKGIDMNIVFKPFVLYSFLLFFVAFLAAQIAGVFLPSAFISVVDEKRSNHEMKMEVSSSFGVVAKAAPVVVQQKKVVKKSSQFLLKEFSISAIFLDGKFGEVIVRDRKSGVFVMIGKSYKGYKLERLFINKAVFVKNGDEYFAFLSPELEKEFQPSVAPKAKNGVVNTRVAVTGTAARAMFEDVKFKNGKYFIPKDILMSYKSMKKIFSSIAIQAHNSNGEISFKVRRVVPGSIFAKIGLKRDDYITQIDNEKFKSISEPLKYFNKLDELKSLSITIKRGNETKELVYEVF